MLRNTLIAMMFLLCAPLAAQAATSCSTELSGDDAMKFDKTNIDIPKSCKTFTINLTHTGKLAKNVMGHNVVIAKTADITTVANDGITAGIENNYIKADDVRVIAHSPLIGGGETTSVTFPVSKVTGDAFSFFCSFPGHPLMMKGTLTVK